MMYHFLAVNARHLAAKSLHELCKGVGRLSDIGTVRELSFRWKYIGSRSMTHRKPTNS